MNLPGIESDRGVISIARVVLSALIATQGALVLSAGENLNAWLWGAIWLMAGAAGAAAVWIQRARLTDVSLAAQTILTGWVAWTLRTPSVWAAGALAALTLCVLVWRGTGE